jgi:hypothetical protein
LKLLKLLDRNKVLELFNVSNYPFDNVLRLPTPSVSPYSLNRQVEDSSIMGWACMYGFFEKFFQKIFGFLVPDSNLRP